MPEYKGSWEENGFFLIPELLGKDELEEALEELGRIYPSGAEYAEGRTDGYPHAPERLPDRPRGKQTLFTQNPSQFAGQIDFPWTGQALNRLTAHPRITEVAATLLGTVDLRIYQAQLWAKYTGARDYEQPLHLDYSSHTFLVPKKKSRPQQIEMFLYLTDVTAERAPTRLVPRPLTREMPPVPYHVWRGTHPELYRAEVSFPGPVGSLLVYAPDIWHRAVDLTEPEGVRIWMNLSYKVAGTDWLGLQSFQRVAMTPDWQRFVAASTPRELELFGFPPPGHDAYDEDVLAGLSRRYPGLDTGPWRDALDV
ncbi:MULTISPECIES: phytanoyl-CoA dioxygenase family protein [Streptomyces]|uniref:phytanoyl-CoA dioxygenase family protein n=2 Tax=Bacteria TaxID=2 RepID=UPI0021D39C46|nr:phytanoyl-CoA dioxygenase family protein [Streptomyces sp. NEAU-383]